MARFEELKGQTLGSVFYQPGEDDVLIFRTKEGNDYKMYHAQDCCEDVHIEEIIGDLQDLVGNPLLTAEERTDNKQQEDPDGYRGDSETWTFYELATIKGSVTIRWYGTSNGYYSESVDFEQIND